MLCMLKIHGDGDLFYPQHMFWLRNKQKIELSPVIWRPVKYLLEAYPI